MSPRTKSSVGCFEVLAALLLLFASFGFILLGVQTPSRSYSFLDLWVTLTTLVLPFAYLITLLAARTFHRSSLRDPTTEALFNNPTSRRHRLGEQFAAVSLAIFGLAIYGGLGWFLINRFLNVTTSTQRVWWAIFASFGVLLAIALGYRLGAARMEDRRRFAITVMLMFIVGGGLPYLNYLWTHRLALPRSFWIGVPLGAGSIALLWWYLATNWDPATLSSRPTRIDSMSSKLSFLFVVGLATSGVFMALDILLGDNGWMLGWLGPVLLFLMSYMSVQAWRYRPREPAQK